MSQYDSDDFRAYCQQATDRQLANIIHSEYKNNRPEDLAIAEAVAAGRGFTEDRIKECRKQGAP